MNHTLNTVFAKLHYLSFTFCIILPSLNYFVSVSVFFSTWSSYPSAGRVSTSNWCYILFITVDISDTPHLDCLNIVSTGHIIDPIMASQVTAILKNGKLFKRNDYSFRKEVLLHLSLPWILNIMLWIFTIMFIIDSYTLQTFLILYIYLRLSTSIPLSILAALSCLFYRNYSKWSNYSQHNVESM